MKLVNISNRGRTVYLFMRELDGTQRIFTDKNYHPFYFEPCENGKFMSHDGVKLRKVIVQHPSEIMKQKTSLSYGSDIRYPILYLINKLGDIEKTKLKLFYLDIEVDAPEMPDYKNPKYPITCITIYNNFTKEYVTWDINDYQGTTEQKEKHLINHCLDYFKLEKPDIWYSWNVNFDYRYMHNRIPNFAETISPVGVTRSGGSSAYGDNIFYPAGISIVDLKGLYEKFTLNKRKSYALDFIAINDLKDEAWDKKKGFTKEKNINDVRRMVMLDEKFGITPYFDEIRRFAKCLWEDLPQETIDKDGAYYKVSNNSKIIDTLIQQEAKLKNVILPAKRPSDEKEEYDGAYRDVFGKGVFYDLGKFDLSSAYPQMVADFCLDTVNLREGKNSIKVEITDRETGATGETYYFDQNEDAILPSVVRKLIVMKDKLKSELASLTPDTPEQKNLQTKYDAIKSIVNSCYGVTGNRFFRLYDKRIAESITFLVRDLLVYVKDRLKEEGKNIIYVDTDSIFCEGKENITQRLNELVKEWGNKKYKNNKVSVKFDYEGYFEKVLILSLCHYYGYIVGKKGTKREIKGIEMKRSSSSKYEAYFQENLIEKILNKEDRKKIILWIKAEKNRIRSLPIEEVSFPSKLPGKVLLNYPMHIRAYDNTKIINKNFKLEKGESFFIVPVVSLGKSKDGKPLDVLAFTSEAKDFINGERINWTAIIERNITGKSDKLFEAMGWKEAGQPLVENTLFD